MARREAGAAGMAGQYIEAMVYAQPAPAARWKRWLGRGVAAWPRQCELCGDWGTEALCRRCVLRFAAPVPRCPRCALPGHADLPCGACQRETPEFDGARAVADYEFPWNGLITRFKFRQQPELALALSRRMAAALAQAPKAPTTLLVPMPLSVARLRERGYNQAWELARHLGECLHIEARPDLLQRWRDTPHQVGLTRQQRETNLRDALWVDPAHVAHVHGRHVALIDDVMTTGASANAAAHALKLAGAAGVQVWVLARTPRTD